MSAKDLSILIPARNEMFLSRTIQDILDHREADTEVIAVLDGEWAEPPIPQNERVNVIKLSKSIGQRAATNLACKSSKAKYVMKVDAHCSFDQGFDRKMLDAFRRTGDNVTMVPIMRNLWAFDWKCMKCGKKWYQSPTPTECKEKNYKGTGKPCDSTKFTRKIMWVGKHNPQSTSYCFDSSPKFSYFEDWKHRPQYEKNKKEKRITETMSLQGSCWMLTRDKYWELNICDEKFGGWGSQGIEVACKTWLSGGRVLVNHNTWYAHMFRTQGGDFSFPYSMSNKDQKRAQNYARDLFFNNKWPLQIHPLSWLVEKFWPVKGWTDEDLKKLKENDKNFKTAKDIADTEPSRADMVPSLSSKELKLSEFEIDSNGEEKGDKETVTAHTKSTSDESVQKLKPEPDDETQIRESENSFRILEGNRLIIVNVDNRSQSKLHDEDPGSRALVQRNSNHGIIYAVEPSKGTIYYSDGEINLKIFIKKQS